MTTWDFCLRNGQLNQTTRSLLTRSLKGRRHGYRCPGWIDFVHWVWGLPAKSLMLWKWDPNMTTIYYYDEWIGFWGTSTVNFGVYFQKKWWREWYLRGGASWCSFNPTHLVRDINEMIYLSIYLYIYISTINLRYLTYISDIYLTYIYSKAWFNEVQPRNRH